MPSRFLPILLLSTAAALTPPAQAESTPAPGASAAASTATLTGPRLLPLPEQRDSGLPPGEVRPEDPVKPQISIPLGKTPPVPRLPPGTAAARRAAAGASAPATGIDDAAARCGAIEDKAERIACRKASRPKPTR